MALTAIGGQQTFAVGDASDVDGSSYPYTDNPSETIQELGIQIVGAPIEVTITTVGGSVFTIPVESPSVYNKWAIDSVELQDPNGNAARIAWWWAGE